MNHRHDSGAFTTLSGMIGGIVKAFTVKPALMAITFGSLANRIRLWMEHTRPPHYKDVQSVQIRSYVDPRHKNNFHDLYHSHIAHLWKTK